MFDRFQLFSLHPFLLLLAVAALPSALHAQGATTDNRLQIANLTQDVRIMAQRLGQLEVRLEQLERENAELKKQLVDKKELDRRINQLNTTLQASLNRMRQELDAASESQRAAIITAVSKQINDLAEQTQKTIDALADYVGHQGSAIPAIQFSDDYPKTGIRYEVKPGDSLARIAAQHNVPVRDIINANRLTNPDRIQVGQNLFIPMRRSD